MPNDNLNKEIIKWGQQLLSSHGYKLRNNLPELLQHNNASNIINNRITQFAKILNLSEQRIIDWCYV